MLSRLIQEQVSTYHEYKEFMESNGVDDEYPLRFQFEEKI